MASNERSAEWLRGAVESHINTCNLITSITSATESHPARQGLMAANNELHNQLDRYRALLAAAEAREGGEKKVDCSWCDGSGDGERDAEARQINPCEKREGRGRCIEAPAPEATPGDSLSKTVAKLREACSGVRVEPEPEEPSAAEVIAAAEKALERLLPWALQAGANAEDALALCARWKEANGGMPLL